jgi:hypothetical protein
VQDDVDKGGNAGVIFPALTRQLTHCCVMYTDTAIQLDGGARDVPAGSRDPKGPPRRPSRHLHALLRPTRRRSGHQAEAIALGVFGGIVAGCLRRWPGDHRQLRLDADDLATLWARRAGHDRERRAAWFELWSPARCSPSRFP